MNRPSLLGMFSLASGLVLGIPIAIVGFEFIFQGRQLLGVGFLAVAVAVVMVPEYVMYKLPDPRAAIKRRLWPFDRRN